MTITPLPTPPSRNDDAENFTAKGDAFLGALPAFGTEANALAVTVNNDAATSGTNAANALTSAGESDTSAGESAASAQSAQDAYNSLTLQFFFVGALSQRLGTETSVLSLADLGGGVVLAGTSLTGQIYKSTDSGATWALSQRLGSETSVRSLSDLGGGVVLAGTSLTGQIYSISKIHF
jgi:hypothetical protein